jgi:hypothetical protein
MDDETRLILRDFAAVLQDVTELAFQALQMSETAYLAAARKKSPTDAQIQLSMTAVSEKLRQTIEKLG